MDHLPTSLAWEGDFDCSARRWPAKRPNGPGTRARGLAFASLRCLSFLAWKLSVSHRRVAERDGGGREAQQSFPSRFSPPLSRRPFVWLRIFTCTLRLHPPSRPSLLGPAFDHLANLLLLAPRTLTPLQRAIPPPHSVVVLAHSLLREDAAAQRHRADLDEHFELHGQAAVDWRGAVEEEVRQEGDGAEAQRAVGEALARDRGEVFGRGDVGDIRWRGHFD